MDRRRLVRSVLGIGLGAAALGSTVGRAVLGSDETSTQGGPAAPDAAGAPADPKAPSTASPDGGRSPYRLRPIEGETSRGAPSVHPQVRTHAQYSLSGKGRRVALTFDDGPDPRYTPEILETLRRHGVRAVFFVIGETAEQFPDVLRSVAREGHLIANHTWNHRQLTAIPVAEARSELERTSELIARTVGTPPTWARAPYGDWNGPTLRICAELGMEPLGWSLDTQDWSMPGSEHIINAVMKDVAPGTIVLNHDGGGDRSQSASALSAYLPQLLAAGYTPALP
ncbi:polysaccharide deacetylase family protein [Streptomyces sulphureus]|uniref:polysaccharide deacetylase family protein n=1 Tax=Streptomyces sulphureus TaxID=47758 RepID=UPI000363301A|nr:polysaccharide deacetylase family protein [Streptomyces sulphureus]